MRASSTLPLAILACFLAYAGATAPTSVDIAEVIVREYSLGTPQAAIAALLGVSVATVGRIAARWRRGEPLTSGRGPGSRGPYSARMWTEERKGYFGRLAAGGGG
jgi:CRP-like cAMP-binding protein